MSRGNLTINDDGTTTTRNKYSETDVTANAPTEAQLTTAFGTPSSLGSGFVGVLNDSGKGKAEFLVFSDGNNFFYTLGVKAL